MEKRKVERPFALRRKGGWVIRIASLLEALKRGESVQFDKVTVGTKPLAQLLKLFPGEYCQVITNGGRLEVETVQFKSRKGKDGTVKTGYVKPKHYYNWFGLCDGAWLKPYMRQNLVVIKPKKI